MGEGFFILTSFLLLLLFFQGTPFAMDVIYKAMPTHGRVTLGKHLASAKIMVVPAKTVSYDELTKEVKKKGLPICFLFLILLFS